GESSHDLRELDDVHPSSNPYFQPQQHDSTAMVPALRPLSEAVISPVNLPAAQDAIALEPASEDSTLNEAILTKRLPVPQKPERADVTMEEIESIVADI